MTSPVPIPQPQPVQEISSGLVPAILVTILCCVPLGIVAIVYAASVSDLLAAGKIEAAEKAAKRSKNWSLAGLICGLLIYFVYILFVVFGFVAQR